MANLTVIKQRLSEAINRSGIPQKKLAEGLGVSQSCVAHYIKGDILPSLEKFADLCAMLDEDPVYILGLEN